MRFTRVKIKYIYIYISKEINKGTNEILHGMEIYKEKDNTRVDMRYTRVDMRYTRVDMRYTRKQIIQGWI